MAMFTDINDYAVRKQTKKDPSRPYAVISVTRKSRVEQGMKFNSTYTFCHGRYPSREEAEVMIDVHVMDARQKAGVL